MKKTISLLLAAALTLTLLLPGQSVRAEEAMKASPWALAELKRAWAAGVFPEEIDPYRDDCTREMIRAEFAAVTVRLYELLGGKLHQSSSFQQLHPHPFTDIDNYDYDIREAYGLGFVNGVDGERFDPNGPLTREQAAAMLGRVCEKLYGTLPEAEATTFEDDGEIDRYAKAAVAHLARNGVVGGVGNNAFAPKKSLTVQEAVVMALRMLETKSWLLPEPSPSPAESVEPEATPAPEESPAPEASPTPEESPDPEGSQAPGETTAPEIGEE